MSTIDTLESFERRIASETLTDGAPLDEARRQLEICNACRYCEGYCAVFPAMTLHRAFSDGEVTQLANLCHNCRGCYHACQYTEPHEFNLNLPRALAEVRVESWERFIRPRGLARLFQANGMALAGALFAAIVFFIAVAMALRPEGGEGFYAFISHAIMLSIFLPASAFPAIIIGLGVRDYWRAVGGQRVKLRHLRDAVHDAARLKNLKGGAAEGCNYEKKDRYTMARYWAHQAVMWGFVLCFAATVSGTVLHYGFGITAPHPPISLPKIFGVPGGILMTIGGVSLIALKARAEKHLGAPAVWGGEMAFILLLTSTAVTGLALYWATGTGAVRPLLIIHMATVLALYLTLPYTKMVHIAFRLTALVRDAQTRSRLVAR